MDCKFDSALFKVSGWYWITCLILWLELALVFQGDLYHSGWKKSLLNVLNCHRNIINLYCMRQLMYLMVLSCLNCTSEQVQSLYFFLYVDSSTLWVKMDVKKALWCLDIVFWKHIFLFIYGTRKFRSQRIQWIFCRNQLH